jgi:hypothetical protein
LRDKMHVVWAKQKSARASRRFQDGGCAVRRAPRDNRVMLRLLSVARHVERG